MLRLNKTYFLFTAIIFVTELCIALFVHDRIIRPYVGDVLAVILIYCFVKAFFRVKIITAAIGVLLFAFLLEFAQYFSIINKLGLQHSRIAKIVLGTSFSWIDILLYIIGISIVLVGEYLRGKKLFHV